MCEYARECERVRIECNSMDATGSTMRKTIRSRPRCETRSRKHIDYLGIQVMPLKEQHELLKEADFLGCDALAHAKTLHGMFFAHRLDLLNQVTKDQKRGKGKQNKKQNKTNKQTEKTPQHFLILIVITPHSYLPLT